MSHRKTFSVGKYETTAASPIGVGSFAEVFTARQRESGLRVAIKVIDLQRLKRKNKKLMTHLESEVAVMHGLNHVNVVQLHDIALEEPYLYMILELCSFGDMSSHMRRLPERRLDETRARFFSMQLRDGLQFLHSRHIIHRDLKPQNLLLAAPVGSLASSSDVDNAQRLPLVLKIADFGFARELTESLAETMCGSPLYMAPEILRGDKYSEVADLWSVGAILFDFLCGEPPFKAETHVQLFQLLERNQVVIPASIPVSRDAAHLILALLQKDTSKRLSWQAFFEHPWLSARASDTEYVRIRDWKSQEDSAEVASAPLPSVQRPALTTNSAPTRIKERRPRASTSPAGSLPMPTTFEKAMAQSTFGRPATDDVATTFLDDAVVVTSEDELVQDLEARRLRAQAVVEQAASLVDSEPEDALALYVGVVEALRHALLRAEAACVSLAEQQGVPVGSPVGGTPYQPIRVSIALGALRHLVRDVLHAADGARDDAMPHTRRRASSNAARSPPALGHSPRLMLEASRHPASRRLVLSGGAARIVLDCAMRAGRAGAEAELEQVFGKSSRFYSKGLLMIEFLIDAASDPDDLKLLNEYHALFEKRLEAGE